MVRLSTLATSTFTSALKVLSTVLPDSMFFSFERTTAPPLPGLWCWNQMTCHSCPSRLSTMPFFRSFVVATARESIGTPSGGFGHVPIPLLPVLLTVEPGVRLVPEPPCHLWVARRFRRLARPAAPVVAPRTRLGRGGAEHRRPGSLLRRDQRASF